MGRSAGPEIFARPEPNPIEQTFAKLKHPCANAPTDQLLQAFTPPECANCFENAGYGHCELGKSVDATLRLENGRPYYADRNPL
jgi:hypothetical protein